MIYAILIGLVVLTCLAAGYLWKRLVWDTTRTLRARVIGSVAAVLLGLLIPVTMAAETVPWIAWPGFIWLAFVLYLTLVLLILEVPTLVIKRWLRRRSHQATQTEAKPVAPTATAPPTGTPDSPSDDTPATTQPTAGTATTRPDVPNPDRRLLLARGTAIFAGLTAGGIVGYGMRTAMSAPRVDRVQIPVAKLPRTLDGLRLAVVSDIHLGPIARTAHSQRIVEVINSVDADIVAVVGDLVDDTVEELGAAAAPLRGIRSRQGTYFVTGDHEYYSGYESWIDEVRDLGMRPLRNERVALGALDLAGVNDTTGGMYGDAPDFPKTFADRDPARPVVLMAHQPVQAVEAARYGVDLQVSGHTHGGQMFPFDAVVRLQQPLLSGYGTVDGVPVYVTNGAGFWGPPVRVGAPPQVTLIELRTP
ncbi:metallophosphoesterase [Actinoplanes sp. NPDC024001]|uniref:metallophosphoesterase n=1 Tax=Actinoplanes sp. NPDC024001 TaxID=3154598 RepID=UPI003410B069